MHYNMDLDIYVYGTLNIFGPDAIIVTAYGELNVHSSLTLMH